MKLNISNIDASHITWSHYAINVRTLIANGATCDKCINIPNLERLEINSDFDADVNFTRLTELIVNLTDQNVSYPVQHKYINKMNLLNLTRFEARYNGVVVDIFTDFVEELNDTKETLETYDSNECLCVNTNYIEYFPELIQSIKEVSCIHIDVDSVHFPKIIYDMKIDDIELQGHGQNTIFDIYQFKHPLRIIINMTLGYCIDLDKLLISQPLLEELHFYSDINNPIDITPNIAGFTNLRILKLNNGACRSFDSNLILDELELYDDVLIGKIPTVRNKFEGSLVNLIKIVNNGSKPYIVHLPINDLNPEFETYDFVTDLTLVGRKREDNHLLNFIPDSVESLLIINLGNITVQQNLNNIKKLHLYRSMVDFKELTMDSLEELSMEYIGSQCTIDIEDILKFNLRKLLINGCGYIDNMSELDKFMCLEELEINSTTGISKLDECIGTMPSLKQLMTDLTLPIIHQSDITLVIDHKEQITSRITTQHVETISEESIDVIREYTKDMYDPTIKLVKSANN